MTIQLLLYSALKLPQFGLLFKTMLQLG